MEEIESKTLSNKVLKALPAHHSYKSDKYFQLFIETLFQESYTQHPEGSQLVNMLTSAYDYFTHGAVPKIRVLSKDTDSILKNSTVIEAHARDIKFLLDSIREFLNECRYKTKLIINPIFSVARDKSGELIELKPGTEGIQRESFIHIEIEQAEEERLEEITSKLQNILLDVQHSVEDFHYMTSALKGLSHTFKHGHFPVAVDEDFSLYEAITFLDWLNEDNFVFLGYRCYQYDEKKKILSSVDGTGKGLMRSENDASSYIPISIDNSSKTKNRLFMSTPLLIDKTHHKSTIHRRVPMDFIEVREFNEKGEPVKWHRFIGLFTRKALFEQARHIPLLNSKLESLLELKRVVTGSSMYREILAVFNSLPKEVLFFSSIDELNSLIQLIIIAYREQAIRLYFRTSFTGGATSIVVAMPEKYFSSHNMQKIAQYFKESLDAVSIQYYQTRSHPGFWEIFYFLSFSDTSYVPTLFKEKLEQTVVGLVKEWKENLVDLIEAKVDSKDVDPYIETYSHIFPKKYQSTYSVETALNDISFIKKFYQTGKNQYDFSHPIGTESPGKDVTKLRIYSKDKISLTRVMPTLENLGLEVIDESAYHFSHVKGDIYLHVFAVTDMEGNVLDPRLCDGLLEEALAMVMDNKLENGLLNALITKTGLDYRQINLLRTYYNYYFQIERIFARKTVAQTTIRYANVLKDLFQLFELKFNPNISQSKRKKEIKETQDKILEEIKGVADISEDRILKAYYNLIDSTLRTNYYSREQDDSSLISIKIDSSKVLNMPDPKPLYEIYVYSPVMEGIHLRGGMIARGGLRWSDRIDDFRTEVLALMKTQMTKNAVIVPVGSKGGFVIRPNGHIKIAPPFIKAQYQYFISSLLDLTDNIVDGKIKHPEKVICYDGEDPYLVVAADKGTAHLSDAANEMAAKYKFWLDDAFASGGSHGYDHKKEGITARGAWECVKRHFREMGKEIQQEEFTVVGVGDMSGDVFGNGMLLSKKIQLKGAFNHIHIFIDPDPNAETSYQERERLFKLPKSSWQDYDSSLISKGGGVFLRNDKAISLSIEIRKFLDTEIKEMSGDELVKHLLKADVELLWNGGIGTYVKASTETDEQVGDKSNDHVRINGSDLRAKVVGEGGNLGLTQLARVEYAMAGGRINTDAIDNSAGVDMSDHEVNLKILFNHLISESQIKDMKERNRLLEELTSDLNHMIVQDNYLQSMAISIDCHRSELNIDRYQELIDNLSQEGLMDVKSEFMPSDKELASYKIEGRGLLRPQLSVLMAYEKMRVYNELLASDLPDLSYCNKYIISYFPDKIYNRFNDHILKHRLKREIIATVLTNNIVNSAGVSLFYELKRDTAYPYPRIASVYLMIEEILDIPTIRKALFLLDHEISAEAQYGELRWIEKGIRFMVAWNLTFKQFLTPVDKEIQNIKTLVWDFQGQLEETLSDEQKAKYRDRIVRDLPSSLPEPLIKKIVAVETLENVFLYLPLSQQFARPLIECHKLVEEVNCLLKMGEVMSQLNQIKSLTIWDQVTGNYLRNEFQLIRFSICKKILENYEGKVSPFFKDHKDNYEYYHHWVNRLKEEETTSFQPFTVILKFLWDLAN